MSDQGRIYTILFFFLNLISNEQWQVTTECPPFSVSEIFVLCIVRRDEANHIVSYSFPDEMRSDYIRVDKKVETLFSPTKMTRFIRSISLQHFFSFECTWYRRFELLHFCFWIINKTKCGLPSSRLNFEKSSLISSLLVIDWSGSDPPPSCGWGYLFYCSSRWWQTL